MPRQPRSPMLPSPAEGSPSCSRASKLDNCDRCSAASAGRYRCTLLIGFRSANIALRTYFLANVPNYPGLILA